MATKSILIGDAGGTKTDWRLIHPNGIRQFSTGGFNLFTHSIDDFKKGITSLQLYSLDEVHIYCAGADTDQQRMNLAKELTEVFRMEPRIENDLLGAARATSEKQPGYVGILGTGANASYYNGVTVEKVSASLGYILGDEGSGAYLGKQLLKRVYRARLNKTILDEFESQFHLRVDQAIIAIYGADRPNQYLASFVPFIATHKKDPQVYQMIYESFGDFFKAFFHEKKLELPIHFVGSVAFHFSDILRQVAADRAISVGKIIDSPIAGLAVYHSHE